MNIICIGKNYAAHIEELGGFAPNDLIFFTKPTMCGVKDSRPFYVPEWSTRMDYEVEIIVKIDKVGKNIEKEFAHKYYSEIGAGIDFTERDIQGHLMKNGLPWERAKSFDGGAYYDKFIPMSKVDDIKNVNFRLEQNGEVVQKSNSDMMLYDVDTIIAEVSKYMTLKIGDLIYTGTPEGIGPVKPGDTLECFIEDESLLKFDIK
ncbi:MAG: fumarylacetoacetate hydrolase family protein [Flavobacteriales bacterium]|nr:fumarylacetoacetate hydrolase family protein [Flavobacteriales bacterium]